MVLVWLMVRLCNVVFVMVMVVCVCRMVFFLFSRFVCIVVVVVRLLRNFVSNVMVRDVWKKYVSWLCVFLWVLIMVIVFVLLGKVRLV